MKVDENDAVRVVAQTWRRMMIPRLVPSHCILTARMATNALNALGVRAIEVPCSVAVYNQKGWEERERSMTEWSPDAWSVGASPRTVAAEYRQTGGFNGHVVVTTDRFLLDLSVEQFDRPLHNIISGGPLVVRGDKLEPVGGASRVNLLEGIYLIAPDPWNKVYKESLDWQKGWRKFGSEFMENVQESLREQGAGNQDRDAYAEGRMPSAHA